MKQLKQIALIAIFAVMAVPAAAQFENVGSIDFQPRLRERLSSISCAE